MDKRGQGGLSMNTIIVAIIGIIVLLLIVTFFTGGTSTIFGKIRDVFTGGTAGYDRDLAVSNCQNFCERAKLGPSAQIGASAYCNEKFDIDGDEGGLGPQSCFRLNVPCEIRGSQICS